MPHQYRNIPIELLRSFVLISETGNFTEAAAALNLTQSAISAQMRRLQLLIGGDVFTKTPAGYGLSDRGRLLETYARRILSLNDQILAFGAGAAQGPTVRLGIQNSFAELVLPKVITECSAAMPAANIQYICDSAPQLWTLARSGYIDVIFAAAPPGHRLPSLLAWDERLVWTCRPGLSAPSGQSVPLVVLPAGFIDGLAIKALEDADLPYSIVFTASDTSARQAALLAGIGFMVTPERCLADGLIIPESPSLPTLPDFPVGVFYNEGFDVKRFRPLIDVFTAAVAPAGVAIRSAKDDARVSKMSDRVQRVR